MGYCVLIIDDNKPMIEIARAEWMKHNIGITAVKDLSEAIAELPNGSYALIIIVSDYVKSDLHSVLRTLRALTSVPIMILGTEYDPYTKISALTLGADEYLTESDTIEEDVATGYALIRRYIYYNRQKFTDERTDVSGKDITILHDCRTVFVKGIKIKFTVKEFAILELLMTHRNKVLPYGSIFRTVWGEGYEESPKILLHNHIKRIRGKIRAVSGTCEYIRSESGIGYAFNE